MIDITNDKFWETDYEIKKKLPSKASLIKKFIKEHKIVSASIICLGICVLTDIYLIYSFFNILSNLN